ncbi:leukotriene A-4 hydrolase-like isoform X2 [Temnothorax nylanderi]|uniref:leukotriene A-4 hydrolase-like isoform X2 n=1 Tax=Temnothorax nylanderi TaxID=102681 RepID=UPI003A842C42
MNISRNTCDPHSFARPEEARVVSTNLFLTVDFKQRVLKGKAILLIELESSINEIILDNLGLDVSSVTGSDGTPFIYRVEDYFNHRIQNSYAFGSRFSIQIPQNVGSVNTYKPKYMIQIEYKTSSNSPALYWLTPEQTADGLYPFLLSNNKLIHARAWFPCQDTPSVKIIYTAKISVPKKYRVLMSAFLRDVDYNNPDLDVYTFIQSNRVPPYAVIIAVGILETIHISDKTEVFAESKFINEYIDYTSYSDGIETMLQVAESLCGPYMWGKYDICVLPPSIAHFKIECPCVTFISPTILNGDRTLISKFALNISQCWAGNLVTCSNYEHLWLNRSFSIFIGRKIYCRMLQNCEVMQSYFDRRGIRDLKNMIEKFRIEDMLNCLLPNLTNTSPHEATKYVPYEKGCMLLGYLENILGGPSEFEPFLRSYFIKFKYESINTKNWKDYLYEYFSNKKKLLDDVAWDEWFDTVPSPPALPKHTAFEINIANLTVKWVNWDYKLPNIPPLLIDEKSPSDLQIMILLYYLDHCYKNLTIRKLEAIFYRYALDSKNCEIQFLWLKLCIKVRWDEKVESALNFAVEYCSPNYACPIFEHLIEWEEMREQAIETYNRNKGKMLYKTQEKLDFIIELFA